MANDALFLALANAKAQPDRWARSVNAGAQAGQDILGGYLKGKEVKQQLDQYRLLQTPLGSMFPDPSTIPFGLSPEHTIKDLLTVAPALENYVPSSLIRGAAGAYGVDTSDNSAPAPSPNPTPIAGSQNPAPNPGTVSLNRVAGDGSGNGGAIAPGTSPTVPPSGMRMNVPAGGMGMKGFQNIILPSLKAGQEERQFQQRQGAEESRFERGQNAEESRFQRGKMAGVAEEAAKDISQTGTIQDDINNLRTLFKGYNPVPFVGGAGARLAAASGSPTFGTRTMQQGNAIQQVAPGLGAKINYELTRRFSPGESELLMKNVAPSATDNEANATMKLNNLQRLVAVFQSGDQNKINMVATAIAGRPVTANIPTSSNQGQGTPTNSSTGDPEADAAIQRIQSSNLNPQAKQLRINAVRARVGRRG